MGSSSSKLPSTLTGPPTLALIPPGNCQFNEEFQLVPLLKRYNVSSTSSVLRFGLPDSSKPLNLSTCAAILVKADLPDREGKDEAVIRPYTPISTNKDVGYFDLLIKNYKENGRMSTHLVEKLKEGQKVQFKHIPFNVKIQAPFPQKTIGIIAGGTGINPMIQALHAILGDKSLDTKVKVLYGNRVSSDILGKELLDEWTKISKDRFEVTHILSREPKESAWKGARGRITKEMVVESFPPPSAGKDVIIFVCGPPPMYTAFCGPREEKKVTGILGELGYSSEQVFKF